MGLVTIILTLASLAAGSQAQSTCTGQQYNDLPGFPNSNSACYPTNYYQTYDLGQTSPSDAKTRCQQYCTNAGGSCQSVVAQINKAADSNLYSGTCFLYAPGQTVTPRQCANTAYMLQGYMKDNTNACFSSSSASASKFCSSYLNIPVKTVTATATFPVVTTTTTVTSTPTVSQTTTVTPVTSTTVTTTNTVTITTTVTVPSVTTLVTSTTTVVTSTVTSFSTVGGASKRRKRDQNKRAVSTVPPPACVTSGTPTTRLSAACSCLSVPTSTTKVTQTLPQVTKTITTTTVVPTTTTLTNTAPPSTSTITVTTNVNAVSTVLTTSVSTTTSTQTTTSTTTSTTTVETSVCTAGPHVVPSNGQVWNDQCNFNYAGGLANDAGLGGINILAYVDGFSSLNQCIDYCASSYEYVCQAVDYYSSSQTGQFGGCFCLYGTSYGGSAQAGVDSAVLIV